MLGNGLGIYRVFGVCIEPCQEDCFVLIHLVAAGLGKMKSDLFLTLNFLCFLS